MMARFQADSKLRESREWVSFRFARFSVTGFITFSF
jgi:hypothetical protein